VAPAAEPGSLLARGSGSAGRPVIEPPPREPAVELVVRSLRDLGRHGPTRILTRLAGGSGSQVFMLDLDGQHAVLKVTEDPSWYDRAAHELAVYRELRQALGEFLPDLVAGHRDADAVRLLVVAHDRWPPAHALTDLAWVELAARLGRLQRSPVPRPPWLRPRPWPSVGELADAVGGWTGHGFGDLAARGAEQLRAGGQAATGAGTVLMHGDCHVGNLLQGPGGRPLWVDWQEVCLGSGLDDLVFLWQRAESDGAHPPRDAMTSAYARARALPRDDDVRSALAACELRLLLVAWAPFLAYGSEDRRQVLAHRLEELVDGGPEP